MRALTLAVMLAAAGAQAGDGPSLQIIFVSASAVQLEFITQPNTGYVIEYRDSVSADPWQTRVVLDPTTSSQVVRFTDSISSSNSTRFYRVRSSASSKAAGEPASNRPGVLRTHGPGALVLNRGLTLQDYLAGVTNGAVQATLSAEEAGILARKLANQRTQALFKCQPFDKVSPATRAGGRWVWRERRGRGTLDFEAEVRLGLDGARPDVEVMLLDSRLDSLSW